MICSNTISNEIRENHVIKNKASIVRIDITPPWAWWGAANRHANRARCVVELVSLSRLMHTARRFLLAFWKQESVMPYGAALDETHLIVFSSFQTGPLRPNVMERDAWGQFSEGRSTHLLNENDFKLIQRVEKYSKTQSFLPSPCPEWVAWPNVAHAWHSVGRSA